MKKINILKESKDFERIIKNNKSIKNEYCYIYKEDKNDNTPYKFGFSVSKKIGNAVIRNKYKRRLKSILDSEKYYNNFNCIIILRKTALNVDFNILKKSLINDLTKLKIVKE